MRTPDEATMRRFLLGELSEEEREGIEERFLTDQETYDELRALEYDILLSYARDELDAHTRAALQARLDASPRLRRELDAIVGFRSALASASRERAAAVSSRRRWMLAGAAAAVVILGFAWWPPRRAATPSAPDQRGQPPADGSPVFRLEPSTKSGNEATSSSFRLPSGATAVEFRIALPARTVSAPEITLRSVGGSERPAPGTVIIRGAGDLHEATWTVRADALPPDDYIVTITALDAGVRAPIASRSFSIVR